MFPKGVATQRSGDILPVVRWPSRITERIKLPMAFDIVTHLIINIRFLLHYV
jgi:hypothetical protein